MRQTSIRSWSAAALRSTAGIVALALSACGGGSGGDTGLATPAAGRATVAAVATGGVTALATGADQPTTDIDAARLAQQASFGATENLIASIQAAGPLKWVAQQLLATPSVYPALGSDGIDRWSNKTVSWCNANFAAGSDARANCWRDYYMATPVAWHFYRQALTGEDQLRQRVAYALSQWIVASGNEVIGTYGLRDWQQMFRDNAFGNYRDLLRAVATSPVMGEYLNNVNNSKTEPNENFARELLQLFSIGNCQLNNDGSLVGGACRPNYDNATVREYAYALTGWTYPAGGYTPYCSANCYGWQNPRYLAGPMQAVPARHDDNPRNLLSGVTLPASRTPAQALESVLDSLMASDSLPPFVARRLIQHLVTGNPSPAYVDAVATAFASGRYLQFGSGTRGDLAAAVAAVLLNAEARDAGHINDRGYGRLREPAQLWTAAMRAADAVSDGIWWGWAFGGDLGQNVFNSPSVFNHYAPDYIPDGSDVIAPAFQIEDASTTLQRLWLVQHVGMYGSTTLIAPNAGVAGSTGTTLNFDRYTGSAADPVALVDRLDLLLTSRQLTARQKQLIVDTIGVITPTSHGSGYAVQRVRTAMMLTMASPQFSIVR
ncbi:DUF1800 family protein [Derxia lacustris]|uniref:DUF1800 family protein n=1 Tax=Derxia lacustris TaxID=764842 RepID=UPI000A175C78|nr:DUF1800 family protein [Derxia lacustris]